MGIALCYCVSKLCAPQVCVHDNPSMNAMKADTDESVCMDWGCKAMRFSQYDDVSENITVLRYQGVTKFILSVKMTP